MAKEISFEEALKKLEDIVSTMEKGEISLKDSIKYYKEGMKLSGICGELLNEAEKEIQVLQSENE